jgi:hypothetical protein
MQLLGVKRHYIWASVVGGMGIPGPQKLVASFAVKPPALLAAPKGLRVVRKGTTVHIYWKAFPHAKGFQVGFDKWKDPSLAVYLWLKPTRRSAAFYHVPVENPLYVSLQAKDSFGRWGEKARVTLKPRQESAGY